MIRALQYAIAALLIGAAVATLAFADNSKCQRCVRRCEKLYCEDVPTPVPTRSPTPPTHSFGKTCDYELKTTRTLTFDVQDEPILICHTEEEPAPFIVIESTNGGNASCANFWMQMYSPSGAISEASEGSQPMVVLRPQVRGRYVIAVYLRQANNAPCRTLTFTVR